MPSRIVKYLPTQKQRLHGSCSGQIAGLSRREMLSTGVPFPMLARIESPARRSKTTGSLSRRHPGRTNLSSEEVIHAGQLAPSGPSPAAL